MKRRNIALERLKWLKRKSERKKLPKDYFLLPEERKFPYRNKDGSVNCRMLRAAIQRAAQHGYRAVEQKARRLYKKYCQGG